MLTAIRIFDGDLRHIAGSREDKIMVLDAVLAPIGHADDKRTKGDSTEQVTDTSFHRREGTVKTIKCPWHGILPSYDLKLSDGGKK